MKNKISIIAITVLILSLVLCGSFSVSAAQTDTYSRNIAEINSRCASLGEIMDGYADRDTSAEKKVAIRTSAVMMDYYNAISSLRADGRISTEDLTGEIYLLYLKGKSSGECAWIYEYHSGSLDDEVGAGVKADYESILQRIRSESDPDTLESGRAEYSAKISLSVYTAKIEMLYKPSDSTEVAVIAAGAISDIKGIAEGSITDKTYDEVYLGAVHSIAVQRLRESATESFAVSYDAIMGEGAFAKNGSSDKNIAAFLYAVKASDTAAEFNKDIADAIIGVLNTLFDGDAGEYTAALKEGLLGGILSEKERADGESATMRAEQIFEGFTLRLASSRAKDSLVEYSRSYGEDICDGAREILSEYISAGGAFDLCDSARKTELELGKAYLRIDWAYHHAERVTEAKAMFEGLDLSPIEGLLSIYSSWDSRIKDAQTLEQSREALRGAVAEADAVSVELEAESFTARYGDIIEKSPDSVGISDKDGLYAAIRGFCGLSAAAREKLGEAISSLAVNYRSVCRLEISALFDSEASKEIAEDYLALIDALEFSDAEGFILRAENILEMARTAREICKIYEDITFGEGYSRFDEKYKASLAEKRDTYLSKIYSADYTVKDIDAYLETARASAALELCRCESEATIDALRGAEDSDTVTGIIDGAIDSLKYADDVDTMRETAAEATIAVYRQRRTESLTEIYLAYRDRLATLGYLGESVKEGYLERLAQKYDSAAAAIASAADEAEADIAYIGGERGFDVIWGEASEQNISEAVKLYLSEIEDSGSAAEEDIAAMGYLSSAEKKAFTDSASELADKARTEILTMKDTAQIEKAYLSYLTDTRSICEKAYTKNIENAKEYRADEAKRAFDALGEEIGALEYISAERAKELLQKGKVCFDECSAAIESAGKLVDIDAAIEECLVGLEAVSAEAHASELSSAKEYYSEQTEKRLGDLSAKIAEMKYLGDESKKRYEHDIEQLKLTTLEKLSGATDMAELGSVWTELGECAEKIEIGALANDLSCAKQSAAELARQKMSSVSTQITSLEYLSDSEKLSLCDRCERYLSDALIKIEASQNTEAVMQNLGDTVRGLDGIAAEASGADLENARRDIGARVSDKFNSYKPSAYKADKYEMIRAVYESAMARIAEADSINAFVVVMEEAYRSMSSVISIFQETRGEEKQRLKAVYDELSALSARYNAKALAELRDIYERSLGELDGAEESKGAEWLTSLADARIAQMRSIKTDWVGYGDINLSSSGFSDYPAGYDPNRNGAWGVVIGSEGIPSNVKLTVGMKEISKHHKAAFKLALGEGAISYVGDSPMTDAEIAAALGDCDIKGVIDLKLIRGGAVYNEFTGVYTVKILLPADMRNFSGLKVMYISGDGSAEYCDARRDGAFLVFDTAHFSEFIIVGERTVNLVPIIVLLSIAAVFEGICAVFVKLMGDRASRAVFSAAFLPICPLSTVIPSGGGAIVASLGAIDIALGVYIGISLFGLIKKRRNAEVSESTEMIPALDFGGDMRSDDIDTEESDVNEPEFEEERESSQYVLPALLDSVSAEEADALVSDSNIPSILVVSENDFGICRGCKKTFINVDTISDNFSAGDTVSLKELKEKGLIPNSACFLKVLARGVINKPLTVRAQSFSGNAIKMISLTGGTAILEGNPDGK